MRRQLSIRIPPEEWDAITRQARDERTSAASIVRKACQLYIERQQAFVEYVRPKPPAS